MDIKDREAFAQEMKRLGLSDDKGIDTLIAAINQKVGDMIDCKEIEGVKRLPKDSQGNILPRFKTTNHTYTLLTDKTGLPIDRFMQFKKVSVALGFTNDFAGILAEVKGIKDDVFADIKFPQARQQVLSRCAKIEDGIIELSKEKYDYSLMLATAVIVREGDDPKRFNLTVAEEMMEDWRSEGIAIQDFFLLAKQLMPLFNREYQKLKQEKEELSKKILAG